MKSETWRKIQAVFFVATIAGAEVQNVEKAVRFNKVLTRLRSPSRANAAGENNVKPESNQIGNALLDKLFGSTIHSSSLNQPDLDETTLGNIGKLFESAMPSELKQGHLHKNILERLGDMNDHSMDDLANQFVNKLFDRNGESWQKEGRENLNPGDEDKAKLENLGKSFESVFDQKKIDASSLHQGDLDKTILGHLSNLANPASHVSARATLPMRSLRPFSRPALGGRERRIPTRSINGDRSINAQRAFQPPVQPKPFNPLAPRFNPLSKRPVFTQAASGATPGDGEQKMPLRKELKKMLALAGMFFSILFVYTILRDTKDVLVVTSGGAEVIPFLKTYCNLPAAIGFTALYATLVNRMTNAQIFYAVVATFGIFFSIFAGVIYPNRALLHPIAWASNLQATLPVGFGPILSIIKYWTFGLFYVMAEMWGSVVVSLLFWGFANDVCSIPEGKRWYPLFGLLANVALIFSGQFIRYVSDVRSHLPAGVDAWGYSLNLLSTAVVIGACTVMGIYAFMQTRVLTDPACMPGTCQVDENPAEKKKEKKKKPKMSISDSFKYLLSSSYIRNLAFLVIAYGTSINLVEVTWKGKLKEAFPDPNDYSSFMGAFSSTTGVVTLGMMLLGRWILNRFGWGVGALVTPTMLGITGIGFFSLIVFKEQWAPLTAMLGLTPLMMAVFLGAAQNILSKASKYSLFDPCKETAYIPLDAEMRTKGKASIDVIGARLGKSGGALIQQGALLTCGSLAASTPFLGSVLIGIVGLWVVAAKNLAVEFEERAAAMDQDDKNK